jgi:hypothetical protein
MATGGLIPELESDFTMHSRRFACLLLGMWLAGGLLMTWLSHENTRAAERLLVQADPAATLRMKVLGFSETSMLMRYEAAELTRSEVEVWEDVQLILGAFFFLFLLFGTAEGKFPLAVGLVLLLCVIGQRCFVSPVIASYGRVTDFADAAASSGYRAKLLVMQGGYLAIEITKSVGMVVLAALLIGRGRKRKSSSNSWNKFNVVDKTDNSHIDR